MTGPYFRLRLPSSAHDLVVFWDFFPGRKVSELLQPPRAGVVKVRLPTDGAGDCMVQFCRGVGSILLYVVRPL